MCWTNSEKNGRSVSNPQSHPLQWAQSINETATGRGTRLFASRQPAFWATPWQWCLFIEVTRDCIWQISWTPVSTKDLCNGSMDRKRTNYWTRKALLQAPAWWAASSCRCGCVAAPKGETVLTREEAKMLVRTSISNTPQVQHYEDHATCISPLGGLCHSIGRHCNVCWISTWTEYWTHWFVWSGCVHSTNRRTMSPNLTTRLPRQKRKAPMTTRQNHPLVCINIFLLFVLSMSIFFRRPRRTGRTRRGWFWIEWYAIYLCTTVRFIFPFVTDFSMFSLHDNANSGLCVHWCIPVRISHST